VNRLSITELGRSAFGFVAHLQQAAIDARDQLALRSYLKSDRRPWRAGYGVFRNRYLRDVLHDSAKLDLFHEPRSLPAGYGYRLDARVVEIPWVLVRLGNHAARVLDAGSALNSEFVLTSPPLANKRMSIVTLAPEPECHYRLGISYVFGDLRRLDFRDELFDAVVCISTIEHVGMNNALYAGESDTAKRGDSREFLVAVQEMKRILQPHGKLFITFPFGCYEDHGWFQQFDAPRVDALVQGFSPSTVAETIFKYEPSGWTLSNRAACAQCQFFDVRASKYFDPLSTVEYPEDYPAGERALACLELTK
jgi:SAM-dependent methyltransferase